MKHIQLFEQFINEAKIDHVKYVKDASKKIFAKGGNGQNVLDYLLDLGKYVNSTIDPKADEWYGPQTSALFQNLVNSMGLDDIEHNNVSGKKSRKKPEAFRGASDLIAVTNDAIKRAKTNGGNDTGWGGATLELAGHIQSYRVGAGNAGPGEDGFYTASTLSAFTRLVDDIAMENIKSNRVAK